MSTITFWNSLIRTKKESVSKKIRIADAILSLVDISRIQWLFLSVSFEYYLWCKNTRQNIVINKIHPGIESSATCCLLSTFTVSRCCLKLEWLPFILKKFSLLKQLYFHLIKYSLSLTGVIWMWLWGLELVAEGENS
jgi:hypothetical protein